jgi:hypothetical protein
MNKLEAHHEEAFFFRREMEARSHHEPFHTKSLHRAFRFVSNYGQSIFRPLMFWGGGVLAWGAAYQLLRDVLTSAYASPSLDLSPWLLAFLNALPGLGFGRVGQDLAEGFFGGDVPHLFIAVQATQTIYSAVMLFLVLLGARNTFRMR